MRLLVLAGFLSMGMLCAADVTGHWSGTLESKNPDGEQRQEPILLILKQDGVKVTGTGGRDLNDRHTVTEGRVEGNKVILQVEAGQRPVTLELKLDRDELVGEASRARGDGSKMAAKVSTKRVKDAK